MAFVNEYISAEDWKNYDLETITKRWNGCHGLTHWVIDRDRNIWLRNYSEFRDRDENGAWDGVTEWDFYWKDILLSISTKRLALAYQATDCSEVKYEYKLLRVSIPEKYADRFNLDEVLHDLKEAFNTYGYLGVFGKYRTLEGKYLPYKKVSATLDISNFETTGELKSYSPFIIE